MESVRKFQDQLIAGMKGVLKSKRVVEAFYAVPRHLFVKKYRLPSFEKWVEVTDQNLQEHLAFLYGNHAMILYGMDKDFDDKGGQGNSVSTISQPSLVLWMIDLLKLKKGQKVLELGAGSGWNAALMGHLVGSKGKVVSLDLIPEMVKRAKESVKALGFSQVEIRLGDGGDGHEPCAPYDRAIFTAGCYDLPKVFYQQIKNGGLFQLVLKNKGGSGAVLLVFQKKKDHFQSLNSFLCDFVPVRGKYYVNGMEAVPLQKILSENKINQKPMGRRPFWWSANNEDTFQWLTMGFRSFLAISEPRYEVIMIKKKITSFGLLDKKGKSLVVVHPKELVSYGSMKAQNLLMGLLKNWIDLGMPGLISLGLKAFPIDRNIKVKKGEWLVKRNESQFLWSMPK